MDEKILWTEYIATNNPQGLNHVLESYGYLRTYNFEERIEAIGLLLEEQGQNATIDLLKQHPDYDLIIEDYQQTQPETPIQASIPVDVQTIHESSQLKVAASSSNDFYDTLKDVLLIVGAIWLVKTIIAKD